MQIIIFYLIKAICALIVITLNGFMKAYISYKLGDNRIKNMGKVSLNPKKHFEIIGFILFMFFGCGWVAPIEISNIYYKDRKKGTILVCALPLIMSLFFAFILIFLKNLVFFKLGISMLRDGKLFLEMLIRYFISFVIFNLIPIYPLYGHKILQTILPANKAIVFSQYEKLLQILVIILLISGILQNALNIFITGINIIFNSINMFILRLF